jgi:hypothetical protein
MINRENDRCWLKAIRRAKKAAVFTRHGFRNQK